jgi:hypothetical protein
VSTDLTCIIFGVVTTAFWILGVKQGVMFPVFRNATMIHRQSSPVSFWIACAFYGIFAWGLLVMPVLSLLGLRR